jgi:hypothetical protein
MYSNLPPPLDGQMQTAVSLLVYKASLVTPIMAERKNPVQGECYRVQLGRRIFIIRCFRVEREGSKIIRRF